MKDGGESLSESQNPYLGGKSNKTHRRLFESKTLKSNKKPHHHWRGLWGSSCWT